MTGQTEGADALTVTIAAGTVRGHMHAGIRRFLGLPYAAPPVGERRFQPPQPAAPWTEVREAADAGPCAPHKIRPFSRLDVAALVGHGGLDGTDYLRLNIWAPLEADKRPVIVWMVLSD
ncbi:hypothetical protein HMF7854_10905 [Sphingomonas ginkgonis]|uniref:Carboxylesterase type B domain-containing protein n=1 Tax=Sphingomonas ginkgonis TaxID=2315330 RepID=A0A3R9WPG8_9SPHN|nr:hypothetical protein HMF7854_10905 [Sphingomonas ginkgonis]